MGFETCHCGRGTVCVCNEHQSAESSPPTTVRGWLETLPEPLRSEALKEWGNKAESEKHVIRNLPWAIWNVVELYAPFSKRSEYWVGVHGYLQGNAPNNAQKVGYHVAKAAFEVPPKTPENIGNFDVTYVSIDPKELAELRAKAAAWDTISPKIQYLSDFYNDLKGLKP